LIIAVIDFIEQQPLKTYTLRRGGGRIRRLIATRRSILAGVVCGEVIMLIGKWWLG